MISIITVVKNGVSTIERTILSVINQDYSDFEYIVIDGVSTDGTLAILAKYSNEINKVISEPDTGLYDAMNKGITSAQGDWIYFLGCDDILYNSSTLSKVFSNNLIGVDVLYGNVEFLHSHKIYDGEFNFEKLCTKSPCHQSIFYRKELFKRFGNFNTIYITTADYVLHVQTFCSGVCWKYIDQIIGIYNETGASFYSKDKAYLKENFRIRFDNFSPFVSVIALSKVFYSSYFRFLISHKLSIGLKYLFLVIKRVGFLNLIRFLPQLLIQYKIANK
jgi:glycosyltransferase involved in cell wall biosynthesis